MRQQVGRSRKCIERLKKGEKNHKYFIPMYFCWTSITKITAHSTSGKIIIFFFSSSALRRDVILGWMCITSLMSVSIQKQTGKTAFITPNCVPLSNDWRCFFRKQACNDIYSCKKARKDCHIVHWFLVGKKEDPTFSWIKLQSELKQHLRCQSKFCYMTTDGTVCESG